MHRVLVTSAVRRITILSFPKHLRTLLGVAVLLASSGIAVLGLSSPSAAAPVGYGEGATFCSTAVPGGYNLGANFDNVYACGPANNSGTGYYVPASGSYKGYFEDAPWTYQCTELADRLLFDVWGKNPVYGSSLDGATFASAVHKAYSSVALISNGTVGQPYLPGDIVSFTGNSIEPDGHVAVVESSSEDSTGNGSVTVMEENASASGQETLAVSNWSLQKAVGSDVTPSEFDALASLTSQGPSLTDLLSNASFEEGNFNGWTTLPLNGGTVNVAAYSNSSAHDGEWYGESNVTTAGSSVFQSVSVAPQLGQSYTFSIWLRSPAGVPASGTLALFGVGGSTEGESTNFTVGSAWTLVSAPLDVSQSGHTGIVAQVYENTVNTNYDFDGGTLASGDQWTPNQAPSITSVDSATFTVGSAGMFAVSTSGSPVSAMSESGALPGGVTFNDNGDGMATLAGTPVAGSAGTYPITITASKGIAPNATQSFTLTVTPAPHPTVSSVSPNKGPTTGGAPITITGTGFVPGATVEIGQGNGTVGAIFATNETVVSSTEITATTGGGAKTGTWNLFVTTVGGTSAGNAGDDFTYTNPVPTVSSVSPNKGPTTGGTPITITGTGFVPGATVHIAQGNGLTGAIAATNVTVVSSTEITATTGVAAKTGTFNLFVTTVGGTSVGNAGDDFTYQ